MQEYKIVYADQGEHLENKVNAELSHGWMVTGGVFLQDSFRGQAVYRKMKKFKKKVKLNPNLNKPLDVLDLSFRTSNKLRIAEINTVEELSNLTAIDLIKMPFIGIKSVKEIEEALADKGLFLRDL